MGWKRLNIAVDCRDDAETQQVQQVLDELSGILRLNGGDLLSAAPMIRKNQGVIREMFNKIVKGGIKNIASVIPLAMQFKK